MSKSFCVAILIFTSVLTAAELPERFAKTINPAEDTYKLAVQEADDAYSYAVQKANLERTKVLKAVLLEATKAGELETALEIKARIISDPLKASITNVEWLGPPKPEWGKFVFRTDGKLEIEHWDGTARWMVLDEHSVIVIAEKSDQFWVDVVKFDQDRTQATSHHVGRMTGPAWHAKKAEPRN